MAMLSLPGSAESLEAATGGAATIRVSYETSINRLRPEPQSGIVTQHNFTVVLSGTKNIEERWDVKVGGNSRQSASVKVLGGSSSEKGGQWRVGNANQLIRRAEYPQNWSITTITLTGPTSCQAAIKNTLKPGFKEYTFRRHLSREIAFYDKPQVKSLTCQIQ